MGNTGTRYERELAKRLADEGWSVIRSPSSGSVERPQPDVFASQRDHRALAVEIKFGKEDRLYLSPAEGRDLCSFASDFDAIPLAVFRFKGDTRYYSRRLSALPTTDAGSYIGDHMVARADGWCDGGLPNAVLGIESEAEAREATR